MTKEVVSKKSLILYSALDNYGGYPFLEQFDAFKPVYGGKELGKGDGCVVIWGGGDISPTIYGQKPAKYCGADEKLSRRDELEVEIAKAAIANGIPIIGVCRGAQLMCALSGGSLIQHVNGHGSSHEITTRDGEKYTTTSLHHQMMFPWETDHELIAWSSPPRSDTYLVEDNQEVEFDETQPNYEKREPEIVVFPSTKTLAIQGHPELMKSHHSFVGYCNQLIKSQLVEKFL